MEHLAEPPANRLVMVIVYSEMTKPKTCFRLGRKFRKEPVSAAVSVPGLYQGQTRSPLRDARETAAGLSGVVPVTEALKKAVVGVDKQ